MRTILFAAALSISGIALAQSQPTTTDTTTEATETQPAEQPSGQTVDDPSQATGPQGVTQQGTDPQGQATTPPGMNQPVGTSPVRVPEGDTTTPRPATTEYPPCSRTVTDSCVQTYERGVRRPRR